MCLKALPVSMSVEPGYQLLVVRAVTRQVVPDVKPLHEDVGDVDLGVQHVLSQDLNKAGKK